MTDYFCDGNTILAVFAGGLDGNQHLPFRLVLPLLRFGGSVFLHAPSFRGAMQMHIAIFRLPDRVTVSLFFFFGSY